jgi:hypothetical protein
VGLLQSTGCATVLDYATGRPTVNDYTIEREVELGTKLATTLIAAAEASGHTIDPDDALTRTVWRVTTRLLEVPENRARMPPLPWEVHVVGTDVANAWCFPGGNLLVAAGMLRTGMAQDEDELAALIGHELGHAAARHGTEKLTLEAIDQRLGPFGRFFGPRLLELAHPDTPQRIQEALARGVIGYDVVQELEADILGLELMARAGYDPAKAAAIWARRAERLTAGELSTHPQSAEREKVLRDHVPAARYVASRRASTPTPRGPSWRWTPALAATETTTTSVPDVLPLPLGPRLLRATMTPPVSLLDAEVRVLAGSRGEALRAAVELRVGRDLREDHLPYSAELAITSTTSSAPLHVYRLAERATLDRAAEVMRVALHPLPPGKYHARVRVRVGALRKDTRRLFEVAAP